MGIGEMKDKVELEKENKELQKRVNNLETEVVSLTNGISDLEESKKQLLEENRSLQHHMNEKISINQLYESVAQKVEHFTFMDGSGRTAAQVIRSLKEN